MTFTRKIFIPSILLMFTAVLFSCKKPNPTYEPSYSRFKINQISLIAIPMTDASGASWDVGISGYQYPDVYMNVEDSAGSLLYDGSADVRNDLQSSALPILYNLSTPIQLEDPSKTTYFTVYDDDAPLSANDLIGKVAFKPGDHKNGYPTSITLSALGVSFVVTGVWY
jgi:hypothetical protein